MTAPDGTAGPVAVVTGASRGLGAGLAQALAAEGWRLGLCARTRPEPPDGSTALTGVVDVTDAAAVDAFADEVTGGMGRIDLWINNAGLLEPIGPLADADPAALHRNLDANVLGVLYGSATFARHVRSRPGGGVLVNLSSGAASRPYEGWAVYCGSKAAVEMITEVVVREEGGAGLRAFALAPGLVDTDMQALIRASDAAAFPEVERFRRVHDDDGFNSAAWVARFILERLVAGRGADGADGTGGTGEPGGEPPPVRLRVPDEAADRSG